MLTGRAILGAAAGYLRQHPEELLRAARNVTAWKVGVPLAALRFLAQNLGGRMAPKDVAIEAVPPGLKVGATIDLMGNSVRASAAIFIERLVLDDTQLRIEVRLRDVALALESEAPDSPVATLLKSGALDLSRPGNLVAYMPKRPAFLVEAEGDRIVLDLKKHPKLGADPRVARALSVLLAWLRVDGIRADWEHLDVELTPIPRGFGEAVRSISHLL